MDCTQFNPQGIPLLSRRGWLGRCLAGTMLISLSWAQPAHADWADDTMAIAKLASQGNFIAAEEVSTQSLNKGPGGLLFAGTGTVCAVCTAALGATTRGSYVRRAATGLIRRPGVGTSVSVLPGRCLSTKLWRRA